MPIEQQIAAALQKKNRYSGRVASHELGAILTKVLETIVAEQKFAGIDLPIKHDVTEMDVNIERGKAFVACTMQIHAPINAALKMRYALENGHNGKLRLHNNHVEIQEVTRPFDFSAKVALKLLDVRQIVLDHLRDPNAVIHRVLPVHLRRQGFQGRISAVGLEIQPDDTIAISVTGDQRVLH